MSESEEYLTEVPKTTAPRSAQAQQRTQADAPVRPQPLSALLSLNTSDEGHRSGPSSGMRVRVHGSTLTPTRSPRPGKQRPGDEPTTPTRWDEPGARTPVSYNGKSSGLHARTGSSVSANVMELAPDPDMVTYVEEQNEHSAQVAQELSQQAVVCLEDEEDTDRVVLVSDEAADRRKMLKSFRKGFARLQGRESCATTFSARSSLPSSPPVEPLAFKAGGGQFLTKVDSTQATCEDDCPVQREVTMEPDAARRAIMYGATDQRGGSPVPQPRSGTRASAPVTAASFGRSTPDGGPTRASHRASPSPAPAFGTANGHQPGSGGAHQREVLRRELARTSRFFWPLNVAPVYVPHGPDSRCRSCDALALAGEEEEEDWLYPYVETHYYCYSLDAEMPALREIRMAEAAVECAEEETQKRRVDAAARSAVGDHGDAEVDGADPTYASPLQRTSALPTTPSSSVNARGITDRERKWLYHRRYQMARLQRLWLTTVMRQYLLFSLSALFFIALFVQSTMQGCMNIFEASIDGGWGASSGVFYSSNNRFGRSVLLTATSFCSSALTLWLVIAKPLCCGASSNVEDAEGELVARRRHSGEELFGGDFAATGALDTNMESIDAAGQEDEDADVGDTGPSALHPAAMLLMGVVTCAAGSVSIYGGARNSAMSLAVFGEALYGVGFVVALDGLLGLTLAEVGLQAALPVQLNVISMSWLITNSAALLMFPLLNRYWLTTAAVLQCGVGATCCAVLLAVCIVLLVPRDVVKRARRPYRRLGAPRMVLRALTNVSLSFLLRTLTFSCVLALVTLLASSATALLVTVPTDLDVGGAGASNKNNTGGRTADTSSDAVFASFFPGPSLQPDEVRQWMAFMFLVAELFWVLLVIPRVGALSARSWLIGAVVLATVGFWGGYSLLTPPLPTDHWGDSADDGTSSAASVTSTSSPLDKSSRVSRYIRGHSLTVLGAVESWLLHQCFHPRVCLFFTGASFAILGTSLVRAIANAGVTLPVVPLCYHEGSRHHRDHRRCQSQSHPASSSGTSPQTAPVLSPVSEATGLLSGREKTAAMGADPLLSPAAVPLEVAVEGLTEAQPQLHFQRCGGATAMLVLSTLVALVSSCVVGIVLAVATWRLSYRAAHPINPSRMGATSIPVDAHEVVRQCVMGLVCTIAGCEVVELVYAFIRARRMREVHEKLHSHEGH